jgi:hypothetical protein
MRSAFTVYELQSIELTFHLLIITKGTTDYRIAVGQDVDKNRVRQMLTRGSVGLITSISTSTSALHVVNTPTALTLVTKTKASTGVGVGLLVRIIAPPQGFASQGAHGRGHTQLMPSKRILFICFSHDGNLFSTLFQLLAHFRALSVLCLDKPHLDE